MSRHRTGVSVAATIDLVTLRDPQAKEWLEAHAVETLYALLAPLGLEEYASAPDGWHEYALAEIAAEGRIGDD